MGTWVYKPFSVFQNSGSGATWTRTPGGGTDDTNLLLGINGTGSIFQNPGGASTGLLNFLGKFYLDGSGTPLALNQLPSGFTILDATTVIHFGNGLDNYPNSDYFITAGPNLEVELPKNSALSYSEVLTPVPDPTGIDTFMILRAVHSALDGQPTFFSFQISGNYSLLAYSWDLPQDGDDVEVDDTITITSPGTDPLTDLDLTQLTISLACGTVVPLVQTQTLFQFAVPAACSGNGATDVTATGNGVQFSGSVPLGSITILLTNASGIYKLSPGATHDTLYSSLRDGTTRNVKIPNPVGKIGFIGG